MRFLVKAYNVPEKKQTTSSARTLASNIGELVNCDEATMKGVEKTIYFRVDIDISKPLRKGINVVVVGKPIWIWFKYVKLLAFCYGCGKLGHILKGCDTIEANEDGPNLQYGLIESLKLLLQSHSVAIVSNWRVQVVFTGSWISSIGTRVCI